MKWVWNGKSWHLENNTGIKIWLHANVIKGWVLYIGDCNPPRYLPSHYSAAQAKQAAMQAAIAYLKRVVWRLEHGI